MAALTLQISHGNAISICLWSYRIGKGKKVGQGRGENFPGTCHSRSSRVVGEDEEKEEEKEKVQDGRK